jgi:hypothetical protein
LARGQLITRAAPNREDILSSQKQVPNLFLSGSNFKRICAKKIKILPLKY